MPFRFGIDTSVVLLARCAAGVCRFTPPEEMNVETLRRLVDGSWKSPRW
jgi:hypothetical protein